MMTSLMTESGLDSERLGTSHRDPEDSSSQDKLVQRYELEDSVHQIEWSASDPWIFAGLSYNGTFFINHVPSKEKYKILL